MLLPFIGYPILAFGSAEYDESVKVSEHGVFGETNTQNTKKVKEVNRNECPDCHGKVTKTMNNCPNCGAKLTK